MRNYIEDAPQTEQPPAILLSLQQQTLLELLNINETAVRLNRAGKLTTDQANFVRGQLKQDADGTWLLSTIFVGTALLLSVIFLIQGMDMTSLLVGGSIFLGAFALYAARKRMHRSRDLDTRVEKIVGDLRIVASDRLAQWGLVIGNRMFPISQALADKFDGYELPVVAAYYTVGTNTLLSMEVLPHEKRKNDARYVDMTVEQPLDSWEKPKNMLAEEDMRDDEDEAEPQPEVAEQEQVSSKRRF